MPYITGTADDHVHLFTLFRNYVCGKGIPLGISFSGTGNGTLTELYATPAAAQEDWTITCTSTATDGGSFSVVGSVSGNVGTATVGTYFSGGGLFFIINDGATDFATSDAFTLATTTYSGTGNGTITGIQPSGTAVTETWTITCTSAAVDGGTFSVSGSTSGAQADATVGSPYDNGLIAFTINDGSTDFVVNDAFTVKVTQGHMASISEEWEELKHTTAEISGGETLYLKGQGLSGTDEIYVTVSRLADNVGLDVYNWELTGAAGFNASLGRHLQPGALANYVHYTLWDGSTPFWLIVDGSMIRLYAKVSTYYIPMTLELVLPQGNPPVSDEDPYPLFVGGNGASNDSAMRWSYSSQAGENRPFWDPTGSNTDFSQCSAQLRLSTGEWIGFGHTVLTGTTFYTDFMVLPFGRDEAGTGSLAVPATNEWATGPDGERYMDSLELVTNQRGIQHYGTLRKIYYVDGTGASAEDIIETGGKRYIMFPSIYRSDHYNFIAQELG